ncbi:esterase-like activity of phytase family protein [Streptomyces sp. ISL-100]|uniref:esterase-like activity of phytase family protein n=1 Tax=Streptomyces sp. ISL-100 TaxID=2819173 RepID=UPI001BE75C5D|nr:esterase-like activity of phytase family protein [Streptomyces sp. ISL-100]MBT2398543.1 WD40 repeat domain-containing protein [Streptomyces sp. ISL-100]
MRLLLLSYVVAPSAAAALLLLAAAGTATATATTASADDGFTIKDPRIAESSGLAASRIHPGIYWTHNDSDDGAFIYAVDSKSGDTVATLTMRGIGAPRDVEAISIGPDGNVYVGDIGDNLDGSWTHVWIYRFPEPKQLTNATVDATQFTVKYADGPRNAEALMVHPKTGRVYIASKNEDGGGLYEGPARLSAGGTNVFRRVGKVPWVTDGAFSPDGKELVLRSYFSARAYDWKDSGRLGADRGVGAPFQGQAESVTYTADGTAMMFGSEGVGSDVERVEVKGKRDSGAESPSGEGSSGDGEKGSGGGGGDGGDGAGGSGDDGGGDVTLGVVVLGGVIAAFVGLRRLLRRRS